MVILGHYYDLSSIKTCFTILLFRKIIYQRLIIYFDYRKKFLLLEKNTLFAAKEAYRLLKIIASIIYQSFLYRKNVAFIFYQWLNRKRIIWDFIPVNMLWKHVRSSAFTSCYLLNLLKNNTSKNLNLTNVYNLNFI